MDLKEAKKLIAWAQKRGIRHIKCEGIEVTFNDSVLIQTPRKALKSVQTAKDDPNTYPAPQGPPTLEDINQFIYGKSNEAESA